MASIFRDVTIVLQRTVVKWASLYILFIGVVKMKLWVYDDVVVGYNHHIIDYKSGKSLSYG